MTMKLQSSMDSTIASMQRHSAFTLVDALSFAQNRLLFEQFVRVYTDLSRPGSLPEMQDCLLGDLISVADQITVFEIIGPDTITYRLCGTKIADRIGRDVTGENVLDLISPEARPQVAKHISELATTPCGHYGRLENHYPDGRVVETETIALPVRSVSDPNKTFILSLYSAADMRPNLPDEDRQRINVTWRDSKFLDVGYGTPR